MSSTRSVPPLDISLVSSCQYDMTALSVHFPVFILGLLYVHTAPVVGVLIMLVAVLDLYVCLVSQPRAQRLVWRQQGSWRIETDRDILEGAVLLGSSRFNQFFCVLHFHAYPRRRLNVLIFPSAMEQKYYSQLLTLLRSGAGRDLTMQEVFDNTSASRPG